MKLPRSFEELIESLKKLPGVGTKSAERMAYQILNFTEEEVDDFASALIASKRSIKKCKVCGQITDNEICDTCLDENRDQSLICVVQNPKDAFALEKAKEYKGTYHIHGTQHKYLQAPFWNKVYRFPSGRRCKPFPAERHAHGFRPQHGHGQFSQFPLPLSYRQEKESVTALYRKPQCFRIRECLYVPCQHRLLPDKALQPRL